MESYYTVYDINGMSKDDALLFMDQFIWLADVNEENNFYDIALSLARRRIDLTLYDEFYMMLSGFPIVHLIQQNKDILVSFVKRLSNLSIEATIFFVKNIFLCHSFMDKERICFFISNLFPIMELTKKMIHNTVIWEEEQIEIREMMGIDNYPITDYDVKISCSNKISYMKEIDDIMGMAIYYANSYFKNEYLEVKKNISAKDLFDKNEKKVNQSTKIEKPIYKKGMVEINVCFSENSEILKRKGKFNPSFASLMNSAFSRYVKNHGEAKDI